MGNRRHKVGWGVGVVLIMTIANLLADGDGAKTSVRNSGHPVDTAVAATPRERQLEASLDSVVRALQEKEQQNLEAKKEMARLRKELQQRANIDRQSVLALAYNLGCVYRIAKEPRKAETAFLKALSIDPDDVSTHYNLGVLYDDDLKQPGKAKHHYERFLALSPDGADAVQVRDWLMALEMQ